MAMFETFLLEILAYSLFFTISFIILASISCARCAIVHYALYMFRVLAEALLKRLKLGDAVHALVLISLRIKQLNACTKDAPHGPSFKSPANTGREK